MRCGAGLSRLIWTFRLLARRSRFIPLGLFTWAELDKPASQGDSASGPEVPSSSSLAGVGQTSDRGAGAAAGESQR